MKFIVACLLMSLIALSTQADDKATSLTQAQSKLIENLLAEQSYLSMTLSPDGRRIAAIAMKRYGRADYRTAVVMIDLGTGKPTLIVPTRAINGGTTMRKPLSTSWIANDLIAVNFSNSEAESVDVTGKHVAALGEAFFDVVRKGGQPTDWVLTYDEGFSRNFRRTNARTGEVSKFDISLPGQLYAWAFDDDGALRAVTMIDSAIFSDSTTLTNFYRASERSPWQPLETFAITDDYWLPISVLPEPDALMVRSRHGRDTWAIFKYDTRKRQHAELLAGHPIEDIGGASGISQSVFDSVITLGMKPTRHWFNPRWANVQMSVDAALPNHINMLRGDPQGSVLVFSYSDVDPGRWLVLDTVGQTLTPIASVRPEIDSKAMRPMETLEYPARDGLPIHAYLTIPANHGPAKPPLVVMIHGGPEVRDKWGFDDEVQLLAASGYVVFQPQFRGSSGFGKHYEEAGYRQWGLAMQDDITDGVKHLIERGLVDATRICIAGASYGGYAALWGVIKTPELYRCGISFAGVSDIERFLNRTRDTDAGAAAREMRRSRIGDPSMHQAELDAVSPIKHVDQIKSPLLISHGSEDVRVPFSQSERFVRTLRDEKKEIVWLPIDGEGHGLILPENRRKYYTAELKFLNQYIGEGGQTGVDLPTARSAGASAPPSQ